MSAERAPPIQLDSTHAVLTPEYVQFNFVVAGLMSRLLALAIDRIISGFIFMLLAIIATAFAFVAEGAGALVFFVGYFLLDWGYMAFFELIWSGQTVGKRAIGLRVIQESGVRVGFYQSILRNLLRPIDSLPVFYLVGAAFALFSKSQQRLGDMVAGTIVVRERRLKIPASLSRPEGDTSLLEDSDFRARVAKLSTDEEAVLFSAAMRREELGMEARLHLFATLSSRLQDDLGFFKPPHLSDEKLVLLVCAALAARNAQRRKAPPKPRRFLVR
jgi:uncharacterized RDD family membrane protein YckC